MAALGGSQSSSRGSEAPWPGGPGVTWGHTPGPCLPAWLSGVSQSPVLASWTEIYPSGLFLGTPAPLLLPPSDSEFCKAVGDSAGLKSRAPFCLGGTPDGIPDVLAPSYLCALPPSGVLCPRWLSSPNAWKTGVGSVSFPGLFSSFPLLGTPGGRGVEGIRTPA